MQKVRTSQCCARGQRAQKSPTDDHPLAWVSQGSHKLKLVSRATFHLTCLSPASPHLPGKLVPGPWTGLSIFLETSVSFLGLPSLQKSPKTLDTLPLQEIRAPWYPGHCTCRGSSPDSASRGVCATSAWSLGAKVTQD